MFKHLDLNSDNSVTVDELAVFLRHLFNEQMKHTQEKLRKEATASKPKAEAAAPAPAT